MSKKTFYISTPIYYPSGEPHIGHAYSTILADVLKRYKSILGYETFFVTGTDEHGKKIQEAAKKHNMEVMEYLNLMVDKFKQLWVDLGIDYDYFSRTTSQNHIETVQKIFTTYVNQNLIYLDKWLGLYCVSCEENVVSKDIKKVGDDCFCQHGHKLVEVSEASYFFKMSDFNQWIKNFFNEHPNFIYPQSRMNELKNNFLDAELSDLSISRSSFDWGIKILQDKSHVIYVWMDALFNYLTALNFLQFDDHLYQKFWDNNKGERVHILSKEITRFHCIYWPIFLHSLGVKLPTQILSHGWIMADGNKMSKSLGNVIDPKKYLNQFGRDALRYYLIKEMSLSNDSIFSDEAFIATYNGDLANNYGNLVSRTMGMLKKYSNNVVPLLNHHLTDYDKLIIENILKTNEENIKYVNQLQPNKVLENIQSLINISNKYVEESKPWELFKNGQLDLVENLLHLMTKIIEVSTFWLQPVLIDGVKTVLSQTNIKLDFELLNDLATVDNLEVNESFPVYERYVSEK